ncbi:protein RGF1 INDUCIBLE TRANSCRIPTION FACTOR 1-like isoform X2 [Apium graveolens]|uniref:protein RGF1 INDUCIBLE TRANSCRIPTION FACTOR 1-like isoform X2 n=1 Tax=Apium graveolens TaxID=4045 RepID=UPI003D78C298
METMQQLVPPWLEQLLHTSFFWVCNTHGDAARSECNMFCLDCGGDAFCFYCRSSNHKDHQVIQIRRSSYHDVVRVSEVQRAIDISGVQTYVINSARVMFLNERPQPKSAGSKGVSHLCEICGRSLLDPFRFCSLGCKLVGIKRNGNASFSLESKNEVVVRGDQGISNRRVVMNPSSSSTDHQIQQGSEELRAGSEQATFPHMSPPPGRRRKGIPHRAPFAS